jgi:exocyst complex component 2
MARSALVLAGGADDRGGAGAASSARRGADETVPLKVTARIQSAYIDALYGFLDGLVHVAFSTPVPLEGDDEVAALLAGRNIDVQDVVRPRTAVVSSFG